MMNQAGNTFLRAILVLAVMLPVGRLRAQQTDSVSRSEVVATIDSALRTISRGDFATLATMMLPEATMYAIQHRDSVSRYQATTRGAVAMTKVTISLLERGFAHQVSIAGPLAVAWVPYDFHSDGKWSHCGVDVLTLLRIDGRWMIASLAYTIAQPPMCVAHPSGP
jgi:hypothetical protein